MAFDFYDDPDFQGNYRKFLKSGAYNRRAFIKEGWEPKTMSDEESADYFQAQSEVVVEALYELGIQGDR